MTAYNVNATTAVSSAIPAVVLESKANGSTDNAASTLPAATAEAKRSGKPAALETATNASNAARPAEEKTSDATAALVAQTELSARLFVKLCQENPLLHEKFPALCGSALPLPLRQYIWTIALTNDAS